MDIKNLIGKTLVLIQANSTDDEILFVTNTGERFVMFHSQDCCESVSIDDISGELDDLINSPILQAEEISNDLPPRDAIDESYTWTFYKLATFKGYVTIKWYGSSNGYYSESVSFEQQ